MDEFVAQEKPWPLYDKWWLVIHSKEHPEHKGFDVIEITAKGPEDFKKVVASIMVPEIDGLVCESHNFIAMLIAQNTEKLRTENQRLRDALEKMLDDKADLSSLEMLELAEQTQSEG